MNKWQAAMAALLFFGMAGCQANNPEEEGRDNDNHHPKFQEIDQSLDEPGEKQHPNVSPQEIAKNLVKVAEGVPDVKDATALVTLGYAVVGIDVDKDVDRSRVGTIKYSVAQALSNERYGANAVVIADPDTVERLKEMGNAIQEGRPVAGILDELSKIVGRVMPQIPSETLPDNKGEKPAPQNPDKQPIPKKDQRNLKNQQRKQTGEPGTNLNPPAQK